MLQEGEHIVNDQVALAKHDAASAIEQAVINGNIAGLTPEQRVVYYRNVCDSVGLNPFTKPFDYIILNSKLTLYAKKDATDQLRDKRKVNIVKLERERMEDIYTVTAYAVTADGRQDSSIGAVSIAGLRGDALANAIMKAETKAKRRVTLSICGLGMLDETEIETIPDARAPQITVKTVEPPAGNGHDDFEDMPGAQTERKCTEQQRKMMFSVWKKLYGDVDGFRTWLKENYHTEHTSEFTMAQASSVIEALQDVEAGQPA
jgi:hypothetical protein